MNANLNHIQDWRPLVKSADWSVSKLAKLCGVSVRVLERHFLEARGQRPKHWLEGQRQQQSFELLCDSSTVKETAVALGYRYAGHFSRDFKAYWGHSPSERCDRCQHAGTCLRRNGGKRLSSKSGSLPTV